MPGQLQQGGAARTGEESEGADSDKAARQRMQQEAPQKLVCGNGHFPLLVAVRIVLPAEGNRLAIEGDEAMIGDGDPMRVSGEKIGRAHV